MLNKKNLFVFVSTVFLFSGFITKDTDIYFEINKSIDIFGKVFKEVSLNYVDQLNPEEFMLAGIEGMLESLDPYTNFIDGSEQKDLDIITKGKYGGIGASVGVRNENITIVDLIEGYSAQRQGIRIGDVIIRIDGKEVTKDNYNELNKFLQGDPGTTVNIHIQREGESDHLLFNLVREEIEIKNLSYYGFVPDNSSNVYLKLSGFSRSAGEEVKKALLELKNQKEINAIILDLRGNPGGLLDAAIDVSEKFLSKGQLIVSVMGRDSTSIKKYTATEEPIAGKSPLIVLIDEGTASASEIVAGAIQDHDRGVIIGTNSFGKGLVQTLIPLSYNTSLKMTTSRYYTPSGRSIQKIDYSEKNIVFINNGKSEKEEYKTDNSRKVFSSGGINPDSLIVNRSKSFLVQKLLADGMFFKFATSIFNENPNMNFRQISSDELIKMFSYFIKQEKYQFVSSVEKLIKQLKEAAQQENLDKQFYDLLEKSQKHIDESHAKELEKYKVEISASIREELAARSLGRVGRIKESLQNDQQLKAALMFISNKKLYSKFLNQ